MPIVFSITGYDVLRRRTTLIKKTEEDVIILSGNADLIHSIRFIQNNTFYYFKGIKDLKTISLKEIATLFYQSLHTKKLKIQKISQEIS